MPTRLGFYWQLKKKFRTPTLPSFLPRLLFLCSRQGLEHTTLGVDNPNCEMYRDQQQITDQSQVPKTSVNHDVGVHR